MSSDDDCPVLVSAKVPVTILTGFLGSGKTTLLHHILTVEHGLKIAVIVNEFEFGKSIEKGLTLKSTQKADDEWLELDNGCMCCTSQSQTVLALESLMRKKSTFDLVLVETSGMADPGPIAAMFWQDEALCGMLFLSGIVTLVDAKHIHQHIVAPDTKNEALRQILACDKIVLNKVDLVTASELESTRTFLTEINPAAEIITSSYSKIADADILRSLLFINTTHSFDPSSRTSTSITNAAEKEEGNCKEEGCDGGEGHNHHTHSGDGKQIVAGAATAHTGGISALSIEIAPPSATAAAEEEGVVDGSITNMRFAGSLRDIDLLCRDLLYHNGEESFEVIRAKAAIWIKATQKDGKAGDVAKLHQLQAICEVFDVLPMEGATVPYGCHRFLILGRRLNENRIREIILRYIK